MKARVARIAAALIVAVFATGCKGQAVLEKDLGDGLVLKNCYRYVDRGSAALELTPFRQFLVVDGRSFEFADTHLNIAGAFRGCSRVFVVILSNYGYSLMVLENDGYLTPLFRIGDVEDNVRSIQCHQEGDTLTLSLTLADPVEGTARVLTRKLRRSGAFPGR